MTESVTAAPTGNAPLGTAVVRGLRILADLRNLHPDVTTGRLELGLRAEIDRLVHNPSTSPSRPVGAEHPAVAAVRTACAHLATRAYEDAYLALVTARGMLPHDAGPSMSI